MYPSIIFYLPSHWTEAYPNYPWAQGVVHPEQVNISQKGQNGNTSFDAYVYTAL